MPVRKKRRLFWYERERKPTDPRLWLYGPVPAGFWQAADNRRLYMDWLGEQLGFKRLEDWYQISRKDFMQWRGSGFFDRFDSSPIAILKDYRPDYEWLEWRLRNVPLRFWQKRANRRRYLEWVGKQLRFQTPEDWYQLSKQHLEERHGMQLLSMFGSSPFAIVKDCFPEHRWLEWRFRQVRQGFWDDPKNRRRYMNWLGKQLDFHHVEDWYQLSKQHFKEWDGGGLLTWFGDSPTAALKDYRPQNKWMEWRFSNAPLRFWDDPANQRRYMDWLGKQLGFRRVEDWYQISYDDISQRHGARLLAKFDDSPIAVVKEYLPDYDWKEWLFPRPPQRFWISPQNRRRYLDWLGEQLGFTHPEDWNHLRSVDISTRRGQGLLKHFRHQIPQIVSEYLNYRKP